MNKPEASFINIIQHYLPDYCRVNRGLLNRNARLVLNALELKKSLSILLVDDQEIRQINRRYRRLDKATNVLSFPFGGDDNGLISGLPLDELGDIFISIDTAHAEAKKYGQPLHDRLTWLITHGILHLAGYDHEGSAEEAALMFDQEKFILNYIKQKKRRGSMTRLAINIDHVATIREARKITQPDPVTAAAICELAGADGIVVHLREDRRHIQDRDVWLLRQTIKTKLNLEMGANKEIIDIALEVKPDMVTLVPEKREELTTEGGLDAASQKKKLAKVVDKFTAAGILVSLFIDPVSKQVKAASDIGADYVEIHTGNYCNARTESEMEAEVDYIEAAVEEAYQLGLGINAGHGLDYHNIAPIAEMGWIDEFSIGHAVIGRAVLVGLEQAVRDMKKIISKVSLI